MTQSDPGSFGTCGSANDDEGSNDESGRDEEDNMEGQKGNEKKKSGASNSGSSKGTDPDNQLASAPMPEKTGNACVEANQPCQECGKHVKTRLNGKLYQHKRLDDPKRKCGGGGGVSSISEAPRLPDLNTVRPGPSMEEVKDFEEDSRHAIVCDFVWLHLKVRPSSKTAQNDTQV